MPPLQMSFAIRSMNDVLPSGADLLKWGGVGGVEDAAYPMYSRIQTLEHMLPVCKVAPGQHML